MENRTTLSKKEAAELAKLLAQLEETPDETGAASRAGVLLNKAGRYTDASKYLWQAFRSFISGGQYRKAVKVADELLSIHTNDVEIMHRLSRMAAQEDLEVPVLEIYKRFKGFHKIPLFSDLSELEYLQLLKASKFHAVKQNKSIIKEGAKGNDIYLIVEGHVRVEKKIEKKSTAVVGSLEEGDFMGEIAFMADKRRSASIIAEVPCKLLSWKAAAITELNTHHPQITQVLYKAFWERSLDTVLSLSPLFKHMSKEERQAIVEKFQPKTYAPKEVILREGEENPERAIYIVKKGETVVFSEENGSFKHPLARHKIGDIFGEYSSLLEKSCTATVMAKTALEVFTLRRDDLIEIVKKDSTMARRLQEFGALRIEEAMVQLPYFQLVRELGG